MIVPQRQYKERSNVDGGTYPQHETVFTGADHLSFRFSEGHAVGPSSLVNPDGEVEFHACKIQLKIQVVSLAILGYIVALINYTVARLQIQGLGGESVDMGPHEGAEVQNSR
jgi:hypothetical protein